MNTWNRIFLSFANWMHIENWLVHCAIAICIRITIDHLHVKWNNYMRAKWTHLSIHQKLCWFRVNSMKLLWNYFVSIFLRKKFCWKKIQSLRHFDVWTHSHIFFFLLYWIYTKAVAATTKLWKKHYFPVHTDSMFYTALNVVFFSSPLWKQRQPLRFSFRCNSSTFNAPNFEWMLFELS